jgi:hypothetical protein
MGRRPPLPPEREHEVVAAYQKGEPLYSLSKRLPASYDFLRSLLKRHGVPIRNDGDNYKLSPDDKKQIGRRYQGGESIPSIAGRFEIDAATVYATLVRLGLRSRRRRPRRLPWRAISERDKDAIVQQYRDGESSYSIGERFLKSSGAITRILRQRGVPIRSASEAGRRCDLNEAAFDGASPEISYWFGFLLADGCLSDKTPSGNWSVSVGLQAADVAHIEAFRAFLGSSHSINIREGTKEGQPNEAGIRGGPHAQLGIVSQRLGDRLYGLGLRPRKSTKEEMPAPLRFDPDAWRGYVDGDGSVSICSQLTPTIGIVGSRRICEQFVEFARHLELDPVKVKSHQSIHSAVFGGPSAVVLIRELYTRKGPALRRKQITAHAILATDWQRPTRSFHPVMIEFNGLTLSVREWSKRTGIHRATILLRLSKGQTPKEVLTTPLWGERPRAHCKMPGCDRVTAGRGFCDLHYSRLRRNGVPFRKNFDPTTLTRESLEALFVEHKTAEAVAGVLRCHLTTVKRHRKLLGLPTTRGHYKKLPPKPAPRSAAPAAPARTSA